MCTSLLLTVVACPSDDDGTAPEGPEVTGVHDMTADFASFKTFDVVEPEDVPSEEALPRSYIAANRAAVYQSIITQMEAHGLQRDQATPDLRISTFVRLQPIEVLQQATVWSDYYWGWYWNYGYSWYTDEIIDLEAGTLVIDAVDLGDPAVADDDVLVFRATASGLLPSAPTDVSKQIPGIIEEMFDFWPTDAE